MGEKCVDHFMGMFSFVIWDRVEEKLFCSRDRFGVKPFYYHIDKFKNLFFASEIKALWTAGIKQEYNIQIWSTYFSQGLYDHTEETFWDGIQSLPAGHNLVWQNDQ